MAGRVAPLQHFVDLVHNLRPDGIAAPSSSRLGRLGRHVQSHAEGDPFERLDQFPRGNEGPRWLIVREGGLIDMRHFFAAMLEVTFGRHGKPPRSEGATLFLGLGVELKQCIDGYWGSCFARDDMVSNRLGARFGAELRGLASPPSRLTPPVMATRLFLFMQRYGPLPPSDIDRIRFQSNGEILLETLHALSLGLI